MKKSRWLAALCATALVIGCSNLKEPATQAVAAAESSLAAVKEAAAQYAPGSLRPVESQIASLQDSLAKGDYKAVMAAAPSVTAAIGGLTEAIKAGQAEIAAATEQWKPLSGDLPKMIAAIQSRVDILARSRSLPPSISKEAFAAARSDLDTLKATWNEASAAFASGNVADAVSIAQNVKASGAQIMAALGMKTG